MSKASVEIMLFKLIRSQSFEVEAENKETFPGSYSEQVFAGENGLN